MNVFELAKKYYPLLWNKSRIESLYEAGKLTYEKYNSIVGEASNGEQEEV